MSERQYSVVVDPRRWTGDLEELADALVRVTPHSAGRLAKALSRGPVTLDSELRREEADLLVRRLERMKLPLRVETAGGEVVETYGPDSDPGGGTDEGAEDDGGAGEATDAPSGAGDKFERSQESGESDEASAWSVMLDGVDESTAAPSSDPAGSEMDRDGGAAGRPDGPSETGNQGWDAALDDAPSASAAGEDDHDSSAEQLDFGAEPLDGDKQQERPGQSSTGELDFGAEPLDGAGLSEDDLSFAADGQDEGPAEKSEPEGIDVPVEGAEPPQKGEVGGQRDGNASADDPRDFDSVRMTEALTQPETENGGAGPDGFDDRPEHIPPLALLLSVLAPGAGAIYNGQTERGQRLGVSGLLIVPWLRSIARAWKDANRIQQGEANKPPRGALKSAFRHVGVWWGLVAGIGVLVMLGARLTADLSGPDEDRSEEVAEAARQNALLEARIQVQQARIEANTQADEERSRRKRFTMNKRERADRLFEIGLEHCRAREFDMCQSAMKKVNRLSEEHRRRAVRLQVWASSQTDSQMPRREMPDVGGNEGLSTGGDGPRADDSSETSRDTGVGPEGDGR